MWEDCIFPLPFHVHLLINQFHPWAKRHFYAHCLQIWPSVFKSILFLSLQPLATIKWKWIQITLYWIGVRFWPSDSAYFPHPTWNHHQKNLARGWHTVNQSPVSTQLRNPVLMHHLISFTRMTVSASTCEWKIALSGKVHKVTLFVIRTPLSRGLDFMTVRSVISKRMAVLHMRGLRVKEGV